MIEVQNSIEMSASPSEVFHVVSDLVGWPRYLPHYRWIRVMENHHDHQVVRMACYRSGIPIDWVSRFHADPATQQLHFTHLKAFTKGMEVTWLLEALDGGRTKVTIKHDVEPVIQRWGAFIAEKIIGKFFIQYVAARTLKNFALYFSKQKSK